MKVKSLLVKSLIICLIAFFSLQAIAQFNDLLSNPNSTDKAFKSSAELFTAHESIKAGDEFELAIRMKHGKGWHSYWVNWGDVGAPTTFKWTLPEGFEAGDVVWPYPHYYEVFGMANYVFEGDVIIIQKIKAPPKLDINKTYEFKLDLDWLVCNDKTCVPGSAKDLKLSLKADLNKRFNITRKKEIDDFRTNYPIEAEDSHYNFSMVHDAKTYAIRINAKGDAYDLGKLHFFPLDEHVVKHAAKQDYKGGVLSIISGEKQSNTLRGVLVSENGWQGKGSAKAVYLELNISGEAVAMPGEKTAKRDYSHLNELLSSVDEKIPVPLLLLFAFVGGLILNLMPCVLPVLSLKIMGFVESSEDAKSAWKHGLAYTAGILLTFSIIAYFILVLRKSGEAVWGTQNQNPYFLLAVCFLFCLMAMSFLSVFEFGNSLISVGSKIKNKGLFGSFSSGVLATVVATPCTGPFMGVAIGATLTVDAYMVFLIFLLMGFGMAIPYLILSVYTPLMKYVPKPGAWMETLKQILGFILLIFLVYYIWLYDNLLGSAAGAYLIGGLILAAMATWILGKWAVPHKVKKTRQIARVLAFIILVSAIFYNLKEIPIAEAAQIEALEIGSKNRLKSHGPIEWEAYDAAKLKQYIDNDEIVFMDFTADWCITCQLNDKRSFTTKTAAAFKEKNVKTIIVDWSDKSSEIGKLIKSYNRGGIPLYVLYVPGQKAFILPQIIDEQYMLDLLAKL